MFRGRTQHADRWPAAEPCLFPPREFLFFAIRGDADFGSIDDYLEGLRLSGAKNLHGQVIANCGKFLPIEAPEPFVKALTDFAPR